MGQTRPSQAVIMGMTNRFNLDDKEPTMSRFAKIVTASAAIVALLGLGTPAVATSVVDAGGSGCCISVH